MEDAFLDGYGSDPRDRERWPVELLREAVGTAAWAFQTGNEAFEAHGRECLDRALGLFPAV
ncbi:hypothetical protein [Tessaracoccus coleopterorum]|uniref:hypothetical protein n=1 Tax=Tessaracoccus coleopterorum TaxID=2714950 RepID=UPI001E5DAA0C|nr:hypothetical protein [Tessaracoccus coleopterorum]